MPNTSPNMNLPIPIVGVDSGLVWEESLVSCLTLIDQHMHAPNYGVQITPSGLNINAQLPFNNNSVKDLGAAYLTQLSSPLSSSNLSVLYSGNGATGDLYWNDGAGNQIKITSGGTVNATSSGISSGTATASFSSGVLVVNAASNTPANIQAGSILLGNNVANSKYLTLSPPAAMAANYTITLPPLPAAIVALTMDPAGNIAANASTVISAMTVTTFTAGTLSVTGNVVSNLTLATGFNLASGTGGGNLFGSDSVGTSWQSNVPIKMTSSGAALSSYGDDRTLAVFNNAESINLPIAVGSSAAPHGLLLIQGRVDSSGTKLSGDGFTCSRTGLGTYAIIYTRIFTTTPSVVVTSNDTGPSVFRLSPTATTGFIVYCYNSSTLTLTDTIFCFMSMGQR